MHGLELRRGLVVAGVGALGYLFFTNTPTTRASAGGVRVGFDGSGLAGTF